MRDRCRSWRCWRAVASGGVAEETRTVAAGPQYQAGGFHEFVFGKGYRDLWTTPIEVPVLDLQKTGGGLTPVRVVGQAQGLGLAFKGADGRAYTFRSLHKHPERMLPESLRDRWPGEDRPGPELPHPPCRRPDPRVAAGGGRRRPHEPAARGHARRPGARRVPQDLRRRVRDDRRVPAPGRATGGPASWARRRSSPPPSCGIAGSPARRTGSTAGPSSGPASSTSGSTTSIGTAGSGAGCGSPARSSCSRCPRTRTWSSSATTGW